MNRFIILENLYLKVIFSTEGAGLYQVYLKSDTLIPVLVTPKNLSDFHLNANYYGKTIGRTSGRLFGPHYHIDDQVIPVTCMPNEPYMLHSGPDGLWSQVFEVLEETEHSITFQGISQSTSTFPGQLTLRVTYQLVDQAIRIDYHATTTADTLCNITNHAYFNLDIASGSILDHELQLNSFQYNVLDQQYAFIKQQKVIGTPFDFIDNKPLRKAVLSLNDTAQKGLDHCFIKGEGNYVGTLTEPNTKRQLIVHSDAPSVVIYTHNFVSKKPLNSPEKDGIYSSITFECQNEPDGIHHPELNASILRKNEVYQKYIEFKFIF